MSIWAKSTLIAIRYVAEGHDRSWGLFAVGLIPQLCHQLRYVGPHRLRNGQ